MFFVKNLIKILLIFQLFHILIVIIINSDKKKKRKLETVNVVVPVEIEKSAEMIKKPKKVVAIVVEESKNVCY